MNKKFIIVLICLVVAAIMLGGCVETFKQEPISGNYDNKTVSSNGGLAVVYGDYLYFINGYASADDENTFGKVIKGAISRVELDVNKVPKEDTFQIVVPKKAYSIEKSMVVCTSTTIIYIIPRLAPKKIVKVCPRPVKWLL